MDVSPSEWPESGWAALRIRLAPLIGERAFAFFAHAVCSAQTNAAAADFFRSELVAAGNDPDRPQVTETEALLIEWGRRSATGTVDAALTARVAGAFSPYLADLLAEGVSLGATA